MVNAHTGKKIIGECAGCKKRKARKPHLELLSKEEQDNVDQEDTADDTEEEEVDCCMKRMLANQADFKGKRSLLEKVSNIFALLPSESMSDRLSPRLVTLASSYQSSIVSLTQSSTTGDGLSTTFVIIALVILLIPKHF